MPDPKRLANLDFDSTYEIKNLKGLTLAGTGWMPFIKNATAAGALDTTSLIAYWKMDEPSGNAIDSHSNGLTLTDTNSVGFATGKINGGRQFDRASNRYFTRASESLLQFGNVNFTISFWVKFLSVSVGQQLVSKRNSGSSREIEISLSGATNKINFELFNGSGSTVAIVAFGTACTAGPWYHVCARHTASSGINLKVNDGTAVTAADSGTAGTNSTAFTIGNFASGTGTTAADAIIDEVAIWKRTLSDAEVTALYNGGSGLGYSADQSLHADLNCNSKIVYGGRSKITSVTAAYIAQASDEVLLCNGTFTVTLPTASGIGGKVYQIKNVGTGLVTVDGYSTETIDGSLTIVVNPGSNLYVISDGANWVII